MGRERALVLAVAADDPVMSVLGPIGLASCVGTALIIDLGGRLGGPAGRTLADLAEDGPRRAEAMPVRKGIAVMSSGGLGVSDSHDLVMRLASGWPAVVVRLAGEPWPGAVVPVVPLFPGVLAPSFDRPSVWQRVRAGSVPPGPGPVLPRLGAGTARRALAGAVPLRGRWLRAWRPVWGLPWA